MIDYINRTRCAHVMTVEDPIEFLHRDQLSHRQPARGGGRHAVVRAGAAQRAAAGSGRHPRRRNARLRDDRDRRCSRPRPATSSSRRSTRSTRPKRSTASSPSSRRTSRSRCACSWPASSRRSSPSGSCRSIDGKGRAPAVEVMIATAFIRDCIVDKEKTHLIPGAIAAGTSQYGMQTFDQSIFGLFQQGLVVVRRGAALGEQRGRVQAEGAGHLHHRPTSAATRWPGPSSAAGRRKSRDLGVDS